MQDESLLDPTNAEKEELKMSPVERLIHRVDGEGKFQWISFIVFCLLWFLTSWLLLGMSFFFDDSFSCLSPDYADGDSCKTYVCSLPSRERPAAIASHSLSIAF
jgi:hypothetical protein